jgi:hypothetical protein
MAFLPVDKVPAGSYIKVYLRMVRGMSVVFSVVPLTGDHF